MPRAHAIAWLLWVALASSVVATEPDGHVRLEADWIRQARGGGPPVVRVSYRPIVPLDAATLTVSVPIDVALRAAAPSVDARFRAVPAAPERHAFRMDLKRLESSAASTFDFILTVSPNRVGVIEFIVEGRDSEGRRIRNAIGLATTEPAPAGVQHRGAIEFPATVLRPAEKR